MASCGAAAGTSSNGNDETSLNENIVSSTSAKKTDDALDAIRNCCKCKESVQGRSSKLLPCLHTVCSPCYLAHTSGGEFECALCFVKSPTMSIVENFVAHCLDTSVKPPPRCNNDPCPDSAIARFYCIQCEDNLCAKCKDAHLRVKYTKDHRLVPINDNKAVSVLSSTCEKHPHEELVLFCNECNILTCRDCQLSQEHSGHHQEFSSLDEAVVLQKEKLSLYANNAISRVNELEGHDQLATQRLDSVEQIRESFKKDLRQAAEIIHTKLKMRIKEMSEMIESACNQRRRTYLEVKTPLDRTTELARQAACFAKAAASLTDKHALLHAMKFVHAQVGLVNRMRKSYDVNVLQVASQPLDLRLPTQEMCDRISRFGTFYFDPQELPSTSNANMPPLTSAASNANGGNTVGSPPQKRFAPAVDHRVREQLRVVLNANQPSSNVISHQIPPDPLRMIASGMERRLQRDHHPPPPPPAMQRMVPVATQGMPIRPYAPCPPRTHIIVSNAPPPNAYIEQLYQQSMMSGPRLAPRYPALAQQIQTRSNCHFANGIQQQQFFATNRHLSPPAVPGSPSGVSSTTMTPPQTIYQNNQQMIFGPDQQRAMAPSTVQQNAGERRLSSPQLLSMFQEFNNPTSLPNPHQHQHQRQPAGSTSIFPDRGTTVPLLMALQPPPYAPRPSAGPPSQLRQRLTVMKELPALVRAPTHIHQQRLPLQLPPCQQGPVRLSNIGVSVQGVANGVSANVSKNHSLSSCRFSIVSESLSAATIPGCEDVQPHAIQRIRAASGTATDTPPIASPSAIPSLGTHAITATSSPPAAFEQETERSTVEIVPISPTPAEETDRSVEAVDGSADSSPPAKPDLTVDHVAAVSTQSAATGSDNTNVASCSPDGHTPEPVSTLSTLASNVTSTTTDEENSPPAANSPGECQNGIPIRSSSADISKLRRHLARKSINNSRCANSYLHIDSSCDVTSEQRTPLNTPPPQSAGLEDTSRDDIYGFNCYNGMNDLINSNDSNDCRDPIETPPLTIDTEPKERRTPEDRNVTTTAEPASSRQHQQDLDRMWDDYCAVCNNGGTLVCCDGPDCRRVFHHDCHIPRLNETPTGVWYCTFCVDLDKYKRDMDNIPLEERRTMGEYDLKICQRILLKLYTHCESPAFHFPVDESVPDYVDIIKTPVDFSAIRTRLDPNCSRDKYKSVLQFISDLNQVFINCDMFNTEDRDPQLRAAGVIVGLEYRELVRRYFPHLLHHVKLTASRNKRRRSRPSSNASSESSSASKSRRRVYLPDEENSP